MGIGLRLSILILLAVSVIGCQQADEPRVTVENLTWLEACERPPEPAMAAFYADSLCGRVTVPEDPEDPDGRQISLAVMVTPALSAESRPDPVVFLAGGPGQAARQVGPMVFERFDELRVDHDLVFVDQRGTGASNGLDCGVSSGFFDELGRAPEAIIDAQDALMRNCLEEMDADPSLYTTPIAMDDLEIVRQHLGYDVVNLYGMSYGTRAALVYLRRYGEHVRSAVLDGVAPMSMRIPANIATDADAALERVFVDCESSNPCNEAFPDLRLHYVNLVKRLQLAPETATLVHPRTGRIIKTTIDFRTVSDLVRAVLYERTLSALLPFAMEKAFHLNYQPLVALAYSFTGEKNTMSIGMTASVLCSEDMRFISPGDVEEGKYFLNSLYQGMTRVCEFWPVGNIPENYVEPVQSDVPVLLVSGTLDPVTPPKYAELAGETLTNSKHIVVPGVGHGASVHGCVPRVVKAFIERPDPGELDDSCLGNFIRPPFFTGYAGPVEREEPAP